MKTKLVSKFLELIEKAKSIVFFGGAGVSTESGIPDFRSATGLFNKHPEELVSNSFFINHPREFYEFYKQNLIYKNAKPNITHLKLAELEQKGKLLSVVTQNIDDLHAQAGSKNVWELHGNVFRNFCMNCDKKYNGIDIILNALNVPKCSCGGTIKPDVVLYEEGLDNTIINGAINDISRADLLIIGGTSLKVYPASGLIHYYKGKNIILINKEESGKENLATLFIKEKLGDVFKHL